MGSFGGSTVLAFESRRAREIGELIRINGGEPLVAPALVEVPLEHNPEALAFADGLYRGEFDVVVLTTGVGIRYLDKVVAVRDGEAKLRNALRGVKIVVRGPKPASVMREWQIPIDVNVPEPNTYKELLTAMKSLGGKRVAVQEYGRTNLELIAGLEAQGRSVTKVPVYQWSLPDEKEPLAEALRRLLSGGISVALFTTGVQVENFLAYAEHCGQRDQAVAALRRIYIASIGPTCSDMLRECGLEPALEPSHPKMGILVREAAAAQHS